MFSEIEGEAKAMPNEHARDLKLIETWVAELKCEKFPSSSIEVFDSADAPLAAPLIRVRPGHGRVYTVGVGADSSISKQQIERFLQFALAN